MASRATFRYSCIALRNRAIGVVAVPIASFLFRIQPSHLRSIFVGGAFVEIVDVLFFRVAQFVLDGADLLLQEMCALLFGYVALRFRLDVGTNGHQLGFAAQIREQAVSPLLDRRLRQQVLFHVRFERRVDTEEVDKMDGVVDVFDGKNKFVHLIAHFSSILIVISRKPVTNTLNSLSDLSGYSSSMGEMSALKYGEVLVIFPI